MPIYEFECGQCGKVFEELMRMGSSGEGLRCPVCGGGQVRKLISACYGRTSGANGSHHSIAGQGCDHGGDCSACDGCARR